MSNAELALITFTDERVSLIKRTLCPTATDDELEFFLELCRRTGLCPLSRQIYAVKRWDAASKREKLTPQVSIDGFRLIAQRTGEYDGQHEPLWCGMDGIWRDVWLAKEPPAAAKVTVYRKGCSRGFTAVATWAEYCQTTKDGRPTSMWSKLGPTMLRKVCESSALRMAFQAELSGCYSPEEMAQAEHPADSSEGPHPQHKPALPAPQDREERPKHSPEVQRVIEGLFTCGLSWEKDSDLQWIDAQLNELGAPFAAAELHSPADLTPEEAGWVTKILMAEYRRQKTANGG